MYLDKFYKSLKIGYTCYLNLTSFSFIISDIFSIFVIKGQYFVLLVFFIKYHRVTLTKKTHNVFAFSILEKNMFPISGHILFFKGPLLYYKYGKDLSS